MASESELFHCLQQWIYLVCVTRKNGSLQILTEVDCGEEATDFSPCVCPDVSGREVELLLLRILHGELLEEVRNLKCLVVELRILKIDHLQIVRGMEMIVLLTLVVREHHVGLFYRSSSTQAGLAANVIFEPFSLFEHVFQHPRYVGKLDDTLCDKSLLDKSNWWREVGLQPGGRVGEIYRRRYISRRR